MSEAAAHIIVAGLVQGVGFRFFAARKAEMLGLTGFVRNMADGSVEVVACGQHGMIDELITVLKAGPRASRVTSVSVEWMPPTGEYDTFMIR